MAKADYSGRTDQRIAVLRRLADATIILFGSRARDDAKPDSDVDFLVVAPEVTSRRREMARLSRLLRPLRIPADILVFSRRVFDQWADVPGTVIYEASEKGECSMPPPDLGAFFY